MFLFTDNINYIGSNTPNITAVIPIVKGCPYSRIPVTTTNNSSNKANISSNVSLCQYTDLYWLASNKNPHFISGSLVSLKVDVYLHDHFKIITFLIFGQGFSSSRSRPDILSRTYVNI